MSWIPSIARDERVILGGLGVMAIGTVYMLHTLLTAFRDEAEVKPVQPKTQYITQETEDALKYSTLETLLRHYNWSIRDTTGKIVCDRAANDGSTIETLLYGITRPDYEERMKNLRALAIITDQSTLHLLHNWKVYAALVRSLELCLEPREKQEKLNDKYFDEYYLRDMAEKLCLMFISQLLQRYEARKLIKAKFVEKWLAKQYWGDTDEERAESFAQYMNVRNNRISEIVIRLVDCRSGRDALQKAGLIDKASRDMIEGRESRGRFSFMLSVDDMDNQEMADTLERIENGSLEQANAELQRLRNRHREAMVFNDGTRPLNSHDIIQRDHGSPI